MTGSRWLTLEAHVILSYINSLHSIDNILVLTTIDTNGDIDVFRCEGKGDSGALIRFSGPGPMFIVGRHAYFQLFVIDPRVNM